MTIDRGHPLSIARWLAISLICLAPWPYAFIPEDTHPWLTGLLFAISGLWAVGLTMRRQRPRVPAIVIICGALLLIQGWMLIANAQYFYDRQHFTFVPAHPWWSGRWVPGALDTVEAFPMMLRVSGLLTVLCVFTDMASKTIWRRRLLGFIVWSGLALTVYGLAQRLLNLPLLLWSESALQHNLFASFYYHGNAGAFVNVLVPLLIAYTTLAFCRPAAHASRAFWISSLMLVLAAEVAIASKAAMLVTGILLLGAGWVSFHYLLKNGLIRTRKGWPQIAIIAVVALLGISLFGFDRAVQRWGQLPQTLTADNPRLAAWRACLRILPDAGPWGIGPGNFKITFPHYTKGLRTTAGIWEHAHEDYLETCIEWGWWGIIVWAVLFGGAMRRAVKPSPLVIVPATDDLLKTSVALALGGLLLHALVDFPFQIPAIQLYAAALLGILWSDPSLQEHESRSRLVAPFRPTEKARPSRPGPSPL